MTNAIEQSPEQARRWASRLGELAAANASRHLPTPIPEAPQARLAGLLALLRRKGQARRDAVQKKRAAEFVMDA
jgi:hypothetical protein